MPGFRAFLAALLCATLIAAPLGSSPANALGTIVAAERAHVGSAPASVGATIYAGDQLSTDAGGKLQLRGMASRLFLSESSSAAIDQRDGTFQVALSTGTAGFSTTTIKGLELLFGEGQLRPLANGPTFAQIKVAGPKELLVTTRRGALVFSLDDNSAVIPEGNTFRVILDPPASTATQGPRGVGTKGSGGPPRKAGRNRFVIVVAVGVGAATVIAVHEALESPDKP